MTFCVVRADDDGVLCGISSPQLAPPLPTDFLFDLARTGLFIYELFIRGEDYADLALYATISLAITVVLNAALVSFVLVRARRKPLFAKWMKDNVVAVGATAVLATTNVTVLTLINSDLFGLNATNAPKEGDVWDIAQLGGLLSVLFEDLPQVIISIAFLVRNNGQTASASASAGVPLIAYLTLCASVLAILVGMAFFFSCR